MDTARALARTAEQAEAALVPWRVERWRASLSGPLAVVATGPVLAAAHFFARLHEASGFPAWVSTPYDFIERTLPPGTRVLVLSAGGRHHDLLAAIRSAAARSCPLFAVVYDGSVPLGSAVREAGHGGDVMVLPAPPDEDETLLKLHRHVPMLVMAARTYGGGGPFSPLFEEAAASPLPDGLPGHVEVLGAGLAGPAATDFANKCLQSGLATAHTSDLRDLTHGDLAAALKARAWLVSFSLGAQRGYAARYAKQIPAEQALVQIVTSHEGVAGGLSLFAKGLLTIEALAQRAGVGRERLPQWAHRLFHLPLES